MRSNHQDGVIESEAPLLQVRDLHAGYGPVAVLHGLTFSVGRSEVAMILGANGAGKTTTLRAISGLVRCQGDVIFDGRPLRGKSPERVVRSGIAHVPQGRGTVTSLTVEENLRLGAYIRHDRDVDADIGRWYDILPRLGQRRNQLAGSMSGGEQQMLAIARALMSRPKLVLLDEPSLGLAPLVAREVFRVLEELREASNVAMLVVEQNASLALALASNAYVLEAGNIVVSGPAESLRENESVRRAYLGY